MMNWYQDEEEEEEEDLLFSPALLARRGSESWLVEVVVHKMFSLPYSSYSLCRHNNNLIFVEYPNECNTSTKKITARCSANTSEQHDESGGSVCVRISAS